MCDMTRYMVAKTHRIYSQHTPNPTSLAICVDTCPFMFISMFVDTCQFMFISGVPPPPLPPHPTSPLPFCDTFTHCRTRASGAAHKTTPASAAAHTTAHASPAALRQRHATLTHHSSHTTHLAPKSSPLTPTPPRQTLLKCGRTIFPQSRLQNPFSRSQTPRT